MNQVVSMIAGIFFIAMSSVLLVYLLFMSPHIYRDIRKFFKFAKEDVRSFIHGSNKSGIYEMTEYGENAYTEKRRNLIEWYRFEFRKDPLPFIFFGIISMVAMIGILIVI